MADGTYECAICEEVFDKGRTDEEAAAEAAILYPGHRLEDMAQVCDVCFHGNIGVLTGGGHA